MSNNFVHNGSAIALALLILISTTGFSVDMHYCQNQLQGFSLIGKAESCHKSNPAPSCHHHKANTDKKDDCCHNETIVIEKSDVESTTPQLQIIHSLTLNFLASYISTYVLDHELQISNVEIAQYKPPLPDRNIHILYQRFII